MSRTPVVAKWLLNITLVLMLLVMLSYGVQAFRQTGPAGDRGILLPVSFMVAPADDAPDDANVGSGLTFQSDSLGYGFILDADGTALFSVPAWSTPHILYYGGILLAFVPGVALVILLRSLVKSVDRGEPFAPANVGRIRAIGVLTIAAEFIRGLVVLGIQAWLASTAHPGVFITVDASWNLVIFVLGAVILALAEVFRYGMQLQSDVDLTV